MSGRSGIRLELYRGFQSAIERWVLPRTLANGHWFAIRDSAETLERLGHRESAKNERRRVWFHAASAGELESLWSVITAWSKLPNTESIVTVFSPSASGPVERLRKELDASGANVVFMGFAPWEGRWQASLARLRPDCFVTAKYEAWPELWASLGLLGIPLAILGALPRKSLSIARVGCRALGQSLPGLSLITFDESHEGPLRAEFPSAWIKTLGDPRWDRVRARSEQGSARAKALISANDDLPRPWGILGSAWSGDLDLFAPCLATFPGTVFVVPHHVDPDSSREIELKLVQLSGKRISRTSVSDRIEPGTIPLVDELGFLSELYSAADWAFVGGGFSRGVHSTIEPAIHAIPLAIGPRGAERFPEIAQLRRAGQLKVLRNSRELERWIAEFVRTGPSAEIRSRWREEVSRRLGASGRTLERIRELARLGATVGTC